MAEGVYVERDVLNIAEKVYEYDSNLKIKACNPSLADFDSAPYILVEKCKDGVERIVFNIWDLNETVLERLYASDTQKNNILVDLDGNNLIVREQQNQRFKEAIGESHDVLTSMLKSNKHKWTYKDSVTGNLVTFDDREKVTKVEAS